MPDGKEGTYLNYAHKQIDQLEWLDAVFYGVRYTVEVCDAVTVTMTVTVRVLLTLDMFPASTEAETVVGLAAQLLAGTVV